MIIGSFFGSFFILFPSADENHQKENPSLFEQKSNKATKDCLDCNKKWIFKMITALTVYHCQKVYSSPNKYFNIKKK